MTNEINSQKSRNKILANQAKLHKAHSEHLEEINKIFDERLRDSENGYNKLLKNARDLGLGIELSKQATEIILKQKNNTIANILAQKKAALLSAKHPLQFEF